MPFRIDILRLFNFILIWTILLSVYSCEEVAEKSVSGTAKEEQFNVDEKVFEELHKQIYENPSLARAQAIDLLKSLKLEDKISEIKLLKYIGSSYAFETNYPQAMEYYYKALSKAEEIEHFEEIANINNNLGTIYNEYGNYKTAYVHFTAALDNYALAGRNEKKIGTLNNIGLIYLNLNNHKKALTYFNEALEIPSQPKDTILLATILNNIAICQFSNKNLTKALEYLDRSIWFSEKVNNLYGLSISYQIMGNIYLDGGEKQKAFDAYTKSLEIAGNSNMHHQMSISKVGIARILLDMGKIDEAFKVAFEVMDMAEEKNSLVLKANAHRILASIYESNKDYENSLKHYKGHIDAKEELINEAVINQIYDVELSHLNQLNKMQHLELEKKELAISKKNNLLFFISLIFILLLAGLYLAYRNHRHKQKVKFQTTVIELTRKKSIAAMEAEIQERKRIGEELHDSLGYLLSLAGLHASVLHKRKDITEKKKNELLESLMESIDEAFEEVRNISHNLAPSLLSERGLKGVLKNIADKVNQSNKLKMKYDTFGLDSKLDGLIENMLYRTIQEIVNNTIHHAEATDLFLQLTQDANGISLMAEDNGKGFDYDEIKKNSSFGLSHIKSGIENLNGTMFVDSKPGRGTIISILIPFQ